MTDLPVPRGVDPRIIDAWIVCRERIKLSMDKADGKGREAIRVRFIERRQDVALVQLYDENWKEIGDYRPEICTDDIWAYAVGTFTEESDGS